jgi:hypothetical protein
MEKFLRQKRSEGKHEVVTQFHIARLFGKAYGQAATIGTTVNGFAKTGVWPVNRNVFQDCHFVAAMQFETNDVPVREAPVNEQILESHRPNTVVPASGSKDGPESIPVGAATLASKVQISLGEISLVPDKLSPGRSLNKAQKTIVIASSPYKQRLEEAENKTKKGKKETTTKRRLQNHASKKSARAKLSFSLEVSEKPRPSSRKESWFCGICGNDIKEDMIQCSLCKEWVHENCAGVRKGTKVFYCENYN